MLNHLRINEISCRIEGYSGSDLNYRIIKAELFPKETSMSFQSEEGTEKRSEKWSEKWSVTVQRQENDGKDFMQEIIGRIRCYQETVHFRVLSASIKGDKLSFVFVAEGLTEEKNEDEWKE